MSAPASYPRISRSRFTTLMIVMGTGLLVGACSSSGALDSVGGLLGSQPQEQEVADAGGSAGAQPHVPKTELEKAIAHWGAEHQKKPADLKIALAYAKNLKAAGQKEQAFAVLQGAALLHGDSKELAGEMGRLALEFDQVQMAEKLLAMAEDPLKPDWRLVSARGTALAKQNKYGEAIPVFERALAMSPNRPSIMSNLAMAHAANGDPATAETVLRKAIAQGGNDPKIKQNLALVLGLQGKHDEAGSARSEVVTVAAASADTEYIKRMVKATPATTPAQATPAVVTKPATPRAAPQNARVIEAKNIAKQPAGSTPTLRPASAPNEVTAPAGSWSTSVSVAR